MKTKMILAALMASAMVCGSFTSCGDKKDKKNSSKSDAAEATTAVNIDVPDEIELEDTVAAESGDAYLAIVDGQWWIQYWGKTDTELAYDAGVVPIKGDGDYTVSVTADTCGFRFDTTGDINGECTPSGCSFASVIVKDGSSKFPNMAIDIKSIKIDGNEIPMNAKNYTSSDDGVEMRANIYNEWVSDLPDDAHSADGNISDPSEYSAKIVDPSAFADGWTTVEVNFTVSGTGA